jgi:hypothetical protein
MFWITQVIGSRLALRTGAVAQASLEPSPPVRSGRKERSEPGWCQRDIPFGQRDEIHRLRPNNSLKPQVSGTTHDNLSDSLSAMRLSSDR